MNFVHILLLILSVYNIKAIQNTKFFSKSNRSTCDFFDSLSKKIVTELNYSHHLIILALDKPEKTLGYTDMILHISSSKPSVFFDSTNTEFFKRSVLLTRSVAAYVVFFNGRYDVNPMHEFLQNLTYILGHKVRPKCLFIYFHNNESMQILREVQTFGWSYNYLDLSIIDVNMKRYDLSRINDYNPFNHFFWRRSLTSPLFPDKAVNVEGYLFKALLPSSKKYSYDIYGNVRSEDDVYFSLMSIAVSHINFRWDRICKSEKTKWPYHMLRTSEISIDLVPGLPEIEPGRWSLPKWRLNFECERFVAFVPFKSISRINLPYKAATYLAIILIMSTAIAVARKLGWISGRFWNVLTVLSFLLGSPSAAQPRTWLQKYTAAWWMFLALTHSSSFYSDIIGLELTPSAVDYDTFQALEESNYIVYVYKPWFHIIFDHQNDPYVKRMQWKAIKEADKAKLCFEDMRIQRNQICIGPEYYKYPKSPLIRMTKVVFTCRNWVYSLEAASPYLERLQKITDRLFETGFAGLFKRYHEHLENLQYQNPRKRTTEYIKDEKLIKRDTVKNVFTKTTMILVLGTGFAISTAVFLYEVAGAYLKYLERRQARYMRRMY